MKIPAIKTSYLTLYNLTQSILWTSTLLSLLKSTSSHLTTLKISQTLATLEILNALLGLTPSLLATFFQVTGRNIILLLIIDKIDFMKISLYAKILFFCWTGIEVIRYPFYVFKNRLPFFFVWIRYSVFYVLYPVGFFMELVCYYYGLAEVRELWSFSFGWFFFDFQVFGWFVMLGYLYFTPFLFFHMVRIRRKKLGIDLKKVISFF